MALTDHIAILLTHSLDVARLNKKKTRSDYYAQFAVPPAAAGDVAALVAEVYPNVALTTLDVNFKTNAQQTKPFPGVPNDWFIIRCATQHAPELYAADGKIIPNAEARGRFFAGMKVRLASSAWGWVNEFGKSGASFNLNGVMDAGLGGDRLAIGSGSAGAAFAAHVQAAPAAANPFAGAAPTPAPAPAVAAANANPFAQAATGSANPFAQA